MKSIKDFSELLKEISNNIIRFQQEIDSLESWKEGCNQLYLGHSDKHGKVILLSLESHHYLNIIDDMIKTRESEIEKIKSNIYIKEEKEDEEL